MSKAKYILATFLLLCFITACRQITDKKFISEGIIKYDITYPDATEDDVLVGLMPKTMIFKFKDDKIAFEFDGGMGLFKAKFISDFEKQSVLHMVKILNKKYAVTYKSTEINSLNEMPGINIKHTGERKNIAGYDCQKSSISFKDDEFSSFDIYFTEDLNIKTPNWSTPYKEINGVLMEYQMKRYNVVMHFTAVSVESAEIDDHDFQKPEDYKIVSQDEMDELFLNLN